MDNASHGNARLIQGNPPFHRHLQMKGYKIRRDVASNYAVRHDKHTAMPQFICFGDTAETKLARSPLLPSHWEKWMAIYV